MTARSAGDSAAARGHRAGLCHRCLHHRKVGNRQGSLFYLCERSNTDERYPKYPPLPMLSCPGYEEGPPDPWARYEDEEAGEPADTDEGSES